MTATPVRDADEILLGFARAVRASGVPVTLDRSQSYLDAVAVVGLDDRAATRAAGRATLCASPEDLERHDRIFEEWFRTDGVRLSSRFRRILRGSRWDVVADTAFDQVVEACATIPRRGQGGTWITPGMRAAYGELHRLGHAHSIEVREDGRLLGGLYGVAIGRMFFGESMFSAATGGSKLALAALARRLREWGWPLLDAQVRNPHLASLGAEAWPRPRFLAAAAELCAQPGMVGAWNTAFGTLPASALAGD